MSTPTGRPKKYAGHGPPDAAFYFSTFYSGQLNKQQLVRGLHIDNLLAREIDDFIDQQLRQDAPHLPSSGTKTGDTQEAIDGEQKQSVPATKLFQLEGGKKTDFALDGICTALISKFACFGEDWRKQHSIPWCWLGTAIHVWVRNNRMEMVRYPASQDELGDHKRRYLEKRERAKDDEGQGMMKRWKRSVRLVDVKLVVRLYCRVEGEQEDHVGGNGDRNVTIQLDTSENKIIVPTYKILADVEADEKADSRRYLDNGDINPGALDYDNLIEACRCLGDAGPGSILAYSTGTKVSKIRNSSSLAKAVRHLREADETANVMELMFVKTD